MLDKNQHPSNEQVWRRVFSQKLSLKELKVILFDLKINYEKLEGTELDTKIISFLNLLRRAGRLEELEEYIFLNQSFSHVRDAYLLEKKGEEPPTVTIESLEVTESSTEKLSNRQSNPDYALVLKGGGIKGLAYVGAIKELNQYYNFTWFVGTSAGAIAAILLAVGYTIDELEDLLKEKDFRDFLDAQVHQAGWNLLVHAGLYHAYTFTDWIDSLLAKKLDSPVQVKLKDLPHRVTIYASRRNKSALIFDSHDPSMNDTPASHAVRCSMSIPFVFTPQMRDGMRIFDGGVQNNYPVGQLLQDNPNQKFVGLYLGDETYEGKNKPVSLWRELLLIWVEATDYEALEKYQDQTVVIDPAPISTINFGLSPTEKQFLIDAGKVSTLKYLRKHFEIDFDVPLEKSRKELESTRGHLKNNRAKKRRRKMNFSIIVAVSILLFVYIAMIVGGRDPLNPLLPLPQISGRVTPPIWIKPGNRNNPQEPTIILADLSYLNEGVDMFISDESAKLIIDNSSYSFSTFSQVSSISGTHIAFCADTLSRTAGQFCEKDWLDMLRTRTLDPSFSQGLLFEASNLPWESFLTEIQSADNQVNLIFEPKFSYSKNGKNYAYQISCSLDLAEMKKDVEFILDSEEEDGDNLGGNGVMYEDENFIKCTELSSAQ